MKLFNKLSFLALLSCIFLNSSIMLGSNLSLSNLLLLKGNSGPITIGIGCATFTALASMALYFNYKNKNQKIHRIHAKIAAIKNKLHESEDAGHVDIPATIELILQAERDQEVQSYQKGVFAADASPEDQQDAVATRIHYSHFKYNWQPFVKENTTLSPEARTNYLQNSRTSYGKYAELSEKRLQNATEINPKQWAARTALASGAAFIGGVLLSPIVILPITFLDGLTPRF